MWRVFFIGSVCLLLALAVGALSFFFRADVPWLPAFTTIADFGIIFGGIKTTLDTTKTANDLRKVGLEVEKLRLEIEEKKRAADKQGAHLVVATLEEIKEYAMPQTVPSRPSWSTRAKWTTSLLAVLIAGSTTLLTRDTRDKTSPLPPATKGPVPSERPTALPQTGEDEVEFSCKAGGRVVGTLFIGADDGYVQFNSERKTRQFPLRLKVWVGASQVIIPLTLSYPNDFSGDADFEFKPQNIKRAEIQSSGGLTFAICSPAR